MALEQEAAQLRPESFCFRGMLFLRIVAHCFCDLHSSNLLIAKQIRLEVLARIASIDEELVDPCSASLKKYRGEEQALEEEARRHAKHLKSLGASFKHYKECLKDPLYSYNELEQQKRYRACR